MGLCMAFICFLSLISSEQKPESPDLLSQIWAAGRSCLSCVGPHPFWFANSRKIRCCRSPLPIATKAPFLLASIFE